MKAELSDDPDKRVTNSDEQEVAVNHSTKEEGGYDEPVAKVSETTQSADEKSAEKKPEGSKKADNRGESFKSNKIN